ncbi:biotin--[acetyl-CoA-carboxylase] ligase [Ethanoligenens harbinense]|uniref:Bifunctional ligase/repressor BirA n=1 Tax=Ethanoligenens harbinense (strain DSM 18485 / JCM 12961 / CGMCC 1.5033 / YUAN-3) TaxID=663278 RepID=E6U6V2_ETHHY|nr:biotin--[acetyl-CoA-carboxylase] ligase [Ethanoligenens harbinense]ADU26919.1 biotin/acetyl-CoA-carboxylase ligase [Ethanoligenens harbinense YUAN-3]
MIKEEVLAILRQNQDRFVSGQAISTKLGVTRAAVWKAVKQIERDGYGVDSLPSQGYKLTARADTMSEAELNDLLQTRVLGRRIIHFQSIDSTNRKAKELAEQGEPEGTIVVAETQTGGRGCAGRTWDSKPMEGIWMSVILRPTLDLPSVPCITQIACAAVGQALETMVKAVQIKWPNDILVNDKKISGVLTESSGEIDRVQYAVVGIGVNVNQNAEDFLPELAEKATSLKRETGKAQSRQKLCCTILEALERAYLLGDGATGMECAITYCKDHSVTLGRPVSFMENGMEVHGTAVDIDERGGLVVRTPNGVIRHISSGSTLVR